MKNVKCNSFWSANDILYRIGQRLVSIIIRNIGERLSLDGGGWSAAVDDHYALICFSKAWFSCLCQHKTSDAFVIIVFRRPQKPSSNEFLHKTWFKALFAYFHNHFYKKRIFEKESERKKHMEEHICQQKMMATGIFFFIAGMISHIFYWKPYKMVHIQIFPALILVQTLHIYNFIWRISNRMSPTLHAVANININEISIYQTFWSISRWV